MSIIWQKTFLGQYKLFAFAVEHNVGEVKRITTTETYLHGLHKFTNYSIQVLAYTNAGDGKRSLSVYCTTEEDGMYAKPNLSLKSIHAYNKTHILCGKWRRLMLVWRSLYFSKCYIFLVPSPPQRIKALALTAETVLVSWLPPSSPNGVISHYTVYHREAGR